MKTISGKPNRSGHQRYVVAMVVGTALSAFGPGPVCALEATETAAQAVSNISKYCTTCWRNAHLHPDCWPDCTQEVFCRLLERVTPESWSRVLELDAGERRELIRAVDSVKKRVQRTRKVAAYQLDAVADRREPVERERNETRQAIVELAASMLSSRQQTILQMTFDGCKVQDIAASLELPTERVADEKYKAIQKLRKHLFQGAHEGEYGLDS